MPQYDTSCESWSYSNVILTSRSLPKLSSSAAQALCSSFAVSIGEEIDGVQLVRAGVEAYDFISGLEVFCSWGSLYKRW